MTGPKRERRENRIGSRAAPPLVAVHRQRDDALPHCGPYTLLTDDSTAAPGETHALRHP